MTTILRSAPTVDFGSILALIHSQRGLFLRGSSRYNTDIGSSGQGAITRIENLAERIPSYLTYAQRDLEEVQKQLEAARQQMGQPFIYEEELSEKVATLTEINTKLEFESLQGQESEVVLDEDGERSDCKKAQSADCVLPSAAPSYKEIILNSFDQYSLLKAYVRRIMDSYPGIQAEDHEKLEKALTQSLRDSEVDCIHKYLSAKFSDEAIDALVKEMEGRHDE